MALSAVGGGYQVGDGNVSEVQMGAVSVVALTADATLTAAQLTSKLITCNKGSDASVTLTLPTVANLEAALVNVKVGSYFDIAVNNNNNSGSSSTVAFSTATGWTLLGNMTLARYTSGTFRAVKTGTGAWSLYAIS